MAAKFFVPAEGAVDAATMADVQRNLGRDIVLIPGEYNYSSISLATLAVFQHAVAHYDSSFVLKVCAYSMIRTSWSP